MERIFKESGGLEVRANIPMSRPAPLRAAADFFSTFWAERRGYSTRGTLEVEQRATNPGKASTTK
jgi:hypothetical protein